MSELAPAVAASGLSTDEARRRLVVDGPNVLPVAAGPSAWRRLVRQLTHFFAVMLWVASGLALVAGLPQLAVAIAVVVVVNGAFAFAQEHRAERAAQALQNMLPRRATVRRDGRRTEVDAAELVAGDLLLLGQAANAAAGPRAASEASEALKGTRTFEMTAGRRAASSCEAQGALIELLYRRPMATDPGERAERLSSGLYRPSGGSPSGVPRGTWRVSSVAYL